MRIDLYAKVRTRDGEDAGTVERAVFDPHNRRITDFVINTGGFLGKEILVPFEEVEKATQEGEVLQLELTKDDLDRMPAYVPQNYVAPSAGWMPPTAYGFPAGWYLWPSTYAYVPPAVEFPETGSGENTSPMIDRGMPVVDANGEDLGEVQDVQLDSESGELTGLIVKVGGALETLFGGGHPLEVGVEDIEKVEGGTIRLRVKKDNKLKARGASQ